MKTSVLTNNLNRMKIKHVFLTALPFVLLTGCATTGWSQREVAGVSYPNYILSLSPTNVSPARPVLARPIRLAVAQVGESAPPAALLQKLATSPERIGSVVAVPAPGDTQRPYYAPRDNSQIKQEDFATRVQALCRLSRNLGADYLFLCGGDLTSWQDSNLLRVFDLTIVGGMILPSTKIHLEGRAAGALIDAATGEPVLMVSTEAQRSASSASFYAQQKAGGQKILLRDELASAIGSELLREMAALSGR